MIILITGTPAVGKHEVAKRLSKELNAEIIDVSLLVINEKLYKEYDKKTESYVIDEEKVEKALKDKITLIEKPVIIITHHTDLTPKPDYTIVVRCPPKELANRLKKRSYDKQKIYDNLLCECLDYCLIAARNSFQDAVYEVETTSSIEETVKEIIEIIEGRGTSRHYDYSEYADKLEEIM